MMNSRLCFFYVLCIIICLNCGKPELVEKLQALTGRTSMYQLEGNQELIGQFINFLDNYAIEDNMGNFQLETNNGSKITINGNSDTFNRFSINDPQLVILKNYEGTFKAYVNNAFYGTQVSLKLSDGISMIDSLFYIPQQYQILAPAANIEVIHKSQGIQINWTQDLNPLNNKGVLIELFYSVFEHTAVDSTVQGENVLVRFLVEDTGDFFVTPQILNIFPPCKWLHLTIAKGNYINFRLGTKNLPLIYKDERIMEFELMD